MAHTHTLLQQWSGAGRALSAENSYSATLEKNLDDEVIPAESTDLLINFTLDVDACKSFYILSDQDLTIETNDGASPDNTLELKANKPYIWNTDSYDTFQLTVDVTKLYATKAAGSDATLNIRALVDPTP